MKSSIMIIEDEKSLEQVIKFVLDDFKTREKNHYSKDGLSLAMSTLQNFDIFSVQNLATFVKSGKIKVFAVIRGGIIFGASALIEKDGRIAFISAPKDDKKQTILHQLLDCMVEERESATDSKLDILAFVGQVDKLTSVGFVKLFDTVLHQHHLKFVPMRFNYTQLDVEK